MLRHWKRPLVGNRRLPPLTLESLESRQMLAGDLAAMPVDLGTQLTTYRLAVASTAEFTAAAGGRDDTISFMNDVVSELNKIYTRDLSIRFELLPVVFEGNDEYSDPNRAGVTLDENQGILDRYFGNGDAAAGREEYDLGHVLGMAAVGTLTNGRGQLGSAGVPGEQGRGASLIADLSRETPATIVQSLIAHEIGHQFGARHTFNGAEGACADFNYAGQGFAFEPGSGSTIMSYAGICGSDNLAVIDGAPYFHVASIQQIRNHVQNFPLPASQQMSVTSFAPTVDAGSAIYSVPLGAPFQLTADASPNNSDLPVHYSWEQIDSGVARQSIPIPAGADGVGPLFRSLPPSPSASRSFPSIANVIDDVTMSNAEERLPSLPRELNFRVAARFPQMVEVDDSLYAVDRYAFDDVTIDVVATDGVFSIGELPATLIGGSDFQLTWSVAETDVAPFNVSSVKISMSDDGGQTFGYLLADSVPNTGETQVRIPNVEATNVRFRIDAVNNVFYAVSDSDRTISANVENPGLTVLPVAPIFVQEIGSGVEYAIKLNTVPGSPVEVTLAADDQTLVSLDGVSAASEVSVTLQDLATQTIYVHGVSDGREEGPHVSLLHHRITASNDEDYPVGATLRSLSVNVVDAELAPVVGIDFGDPNDASIRLHPERWTQEGGNDLTWDNGQPSPIDFQLLSSPLGTGGFTLLEVPRHSPSLKQLNGFYVFQQSAAAEWRDLDPAKTYRVYVMAQFVPFPAPFAASSLNQTIRVSGATEPISFVQSRQEAWPLVINSDANITDRSLDSFGVEVRPAADGTIRIEIDHNGPPAGEQPLVYVGGMAISEVAAVPVRPAGVQLTVSSELKTTEAGGTTSFQVSLTSTPTSDVTIRFASSNDGEGTVSPATIVFLPEDAMTAQTVTVTGQDDETVDGDQEYRIVATVVSVDENYNRIEVMPLVLSNSDDDARQRIIGDANSDGVFDSSDLVVVFVAGEYEDDIEGNSVFETGDWDGDGEFTTSDLVAAFVAGNYLSL